MLGKSLVSVVAVVAVAATVAPATAATATAPGARYFAQHVTWGACPFQPQPMAKPSECALITVPRDWANPTAGADLQVSISRVKAAGYRRGSLLVNSGGPGGQGTSLAGVLAGLEPSVSEVYDLIGMDPRGTGREGSDPGFQCAIPDEQISATLDARDRSPRSIAQHQRIARATAEICRSNPISPYITTWQTAHDMDLIRVLLGDEKLNYFGYSYGTWLGAKYASLFPAHAGRTVLDSSVDFEGRLQASFEAFPMINQRQFDDVYLPWLARRYGDKLGKTATSVKATWERARAYYKARGLTADTFDELYVGNASPAQWYLGALVVSVARNAMGGGIADPGGKLDATARATFGVPLAELTVPKIVDSLMQRESGYTKVSGTRTAVACGDQPTRSADWYKRLSDRQGPEYPLFGWNYGLIEPCGFWSGTPAHELPDLSPQAAKNILVVEGEFDPQTGYEQAKAASREARVPLLSVDDSPFHAQYAIAGNRCVDSMVNAFFVEDTHPRNTTCPSTPLPDETVVHPVAGPLDGPSANTTAHADGRLSGLRDYLQKMIGDFGRSNSHR
jgi:pimeloyl-ACP methyl ester carboxylesterase